MHCNARSCMALVSKDTRSGRDALLTPDFSNGKTERKEGGTIQWD